VETMNRNTVLQMLSYRFMCRFTPLIIWPHDNIL